jgi:hypothetical protein
MASTILPEQMGAPILPDGLPLLTTLSHLGFCHMRHLTLDREETAPVELLKTGPRLPSASLHHSMLLLFPRESPPVLQQTNAGTSLTPLHAARTPGSRALVHRMPPSRSNCRS